MPKPRYPQGNSFRQHRETARATVSCCDVLGPGPDSVFCLVRIRTGFQETGKQAGKPFTFSSSSVTFDRCACNRDGVNVEPFWPGLFAEALANVNIGSFISNIQALEPAPAESSVPVPSHTASPAQVKKTEAKKEESKESDDDMDLGLLD
ncbi:hypothetical protein ACRRTK_019337 [Alexandromys fortis]